MDEEGRVAFSILSIDIPDFVKKLKEIVSSWGHEMVNPMILDGMSYHVSFSKDGEEEVKYHGRNQFPENYHEFRDLLRSLL